MASDQPLCALRKLHIWCYTLALSAGYVGTDPGELALCDCEVATGPPNGLSCEKEGWFVSSFEREGSWVRSTHTTLLYFFADCRNLHSAMLPVLLQLTGGGLVPLSRARCCRPCLPAELPDSQGQLSPGAKPVAVVSIGCHKSSGQGSDALKCEPQGSSFVTGFGQAIRVSNAANYYYPVGAVDCCTPSVLLSTGEAWELERCDCEFSVDINCGETDNNRLLQGFERWRSPLSSFPPGSPRLDYRDQWHASCAFESFGRPWSLPSCTVKALLPHSTAYSSCCFHCRDLITADEHNAHQITHGHQICNCNCRITALGLVPIAPAQCCKTCLSKTIHPLDSCSDLNFCSGHGVCNLGSCDCLDGFGGPDCSSQVSFVRLLLELLLSDCC